MNILILGAGKIGTAVKRLLSRYNNIKIGIVDELYIDILRTRQWSCVINCTPAVYQYGLMVLDLGIPFFDVSGDYNQAIKLNDHPNSHKYMHGLGLAPGLVNILAHRGNKLVDATDIVMCCGGLPINRNINMYGYFPTWSVDGIVKNYTTRASIKKDGVIHNHFPFDYPLSYETINGQNYEKILTYGAIDDTSELPAKNIAYYTLRYPGHYENIKEILRLPNSESVLKYVMLGLVSDLSTINFEDYDDKVVIYISAKNKHEHNCFEKRLEIKSGDGLTAMQFSTAASAISTVLALYDEDIKSFCTLTPGKKYDALVKNLYYAKFTKYMHKFGIDLIDY